MPFNVNGFKGEINKQGSLAQPNKFRVLITGGVLKNSKAQALSFLVNQAVIPGRALITNEIRTHGPIRKAPYNTMYDDLQMGIYCTNKNLFPRDLFEEWQSSIVQTMTGRVNYFDQYVADIEIEQYDDNQNIIFACKFIDAYPMIVSPLSLDWAMTNTFQNLNVTFAYRRWHLQPLPLSPFGNNLAINSLYPNFDIEGAIDNFGIAVVSRADGQFMAQTKKAGNFLGNIF
jgi:hypothetical protein